MRTKYGSLAVAQRTKDHITATGRLTIRQGGYAITASFKRRECDDHVIIGVASAHFHTISFEAYRHRSHRHATPTARLRLEAATLKAINETFAPERIMPSRRATADR